MISRHTSISKLEVGRANFYSKHVKRAQILRFANKHRLLVELDFYAFLLKADDAVALIGRLSSLKYFRFRLKNMTEFLYLASQLHVLGIIFYAHLRDKITTIVELHFNRNTQLVQ